MQESTLKNTGLSEPWADLAFAFRSEGVAKGFREGYGYGSYLDEATAIDGVYIIKS